MNFTQEIEQLRQILGGASEEVTTTYTNYFFWEGIIGLVTSMVVILLATLGVRWIMRKLKQGVDEGTLGDDDVVAANIGVITVVLIAAVVGIIYVPDSLSQVLNPKAHAIKLLIESLP